jgi:hypothetical protein
MIRQASPGSNCNWIAAGRLCSPPRNFQAMTSDDSPETRVRLHSLLYGPPRPRKRGPAWFRLELCEDWSDTKECTGYPDCTH